MTAMIHVTDKDMEIAGGITASSMSRIAGVI